MSNLIIVCVAILTVAFQLSIIDAQITISTSGPITTATETTDAGLTDSTEEVTVVTTEVATEVATGSTILDEVTATTLEATSYIDDTAIFCRAYLLNNTSWEPYPTYSDNGSHHLCASLFAVVGLMIARIFV